MTKHKKILICCILSAILTIVTIVPIFATTSNDYLKVPPDDLGTLLDRTYIAYNNLHKFYLVIDTSIYTTNNIRFVYSNTANNDKTTSNLMTITIENNKIITNVIDTNYELYGDYFYVVCPIINFDIESIYYYIPIYCFNSNPDPRYLPNGVSLYISTTTSTSDLQREAFEVGYQNGYTDGFDEGLYEGQNIQQYTNLVGYIEQLIGQFTGSSAAQYITPIAIVLVVLFVYFLFIRFLLSLVKAKGIIKTCDIIMIVACIIMLVVMYAPMLDLTIKTEQIYTSEEDTETVQVRNSNIYVVPTETGDIYYGPVGTAIVTKSETIEEVYKITKDIETEAIAYEKD